LGVGDSVRDYGEVPIGGLEEAGSRDEGRDTMSVSPSAIRIRLK